MSTTLESDVLLAEAPDAVAVATPPMSDQQMFNKLTDRERAVLRFIAQGYSAPEIGERLSISPKTVDTYKQRIQEKIGLSHRSHYVQFAFRLGLLTG